MFDRLLDYLIASPLTDDEFERDQLFQAILDRRVVILIGPASTVTLALMAIYFTGAWWPVLWIALDLFLTAARWKVMIAALDASLEKRQRSSKILVVLGAAWMLTLGVAVHLCLLAGNLALTVVVAIIVTGTASIVTSRNASTPRHALLMLLLIGLPFTLGLLRSPFDAMIVPAALIAVWISSLYLFMLQNHASMLRLVKAETAARRAAEIDDLTGLFNRMHFRERRAQLDALGAAGDNRYCLLCIDLDGFKAVNDRHGHDAGDQLLRAVARRMKDKLRQGDTLFRIGGDEFVALLPSAKPDDCQLIADRLLGELSAPFELDNGVEVSVGASIGSACARPSLVGSQALLLAADNAMYRAKAAGKGLHIHV